MGYIHSDLFLLKTTAMIIGYSLVWVVLVVGANCTNLKNIWCLDENTESHTNLIKDNITQDDIECKAGMVNDPWNNTDQRTSPAPSHLTVNYYTYGVNATRQIAINITWRQKAAHLQYLDGYLLEVNFLIPHGDPEYYKMTWDKSQSVLRDIDQAFPKMEFHFIYWGIHIKPNQKYFFIIQGLPIYAEKDSPQGVNKMLKIPGCTDKEISKTASCVKKSCPDGFRRRGRNCVSRTSRSRKKPKSPVKTTEEFTKGSATEEPNLATFIIVGAIIVIIIMLVFFIFFHCRRHRNGFLQSCMGGKKNPPPSTRERHILIIKDIKEDRFSEAIKELMRMLQNIDQLHITTNAWHTVEIGEQGPVKWATKAVDEADLVVFLASDRSNFITDETEETKLLEDGQHVLLNIIRNIIHSLKESPEWNHKKFIIADLNHCVTKKNFPYFQHYNLPDGFKKFSRHLLNDLHFIEKDKTIFTNLLTNAQLGHGMRSDQVNGVYVQEGHNDLDTHENPSLLKTKREQLNIVMEGLPSWENDTSQPYITMDYNNSIDRYHQAGARPKTQC